MLPELLDFSKVAQNCAHRSKIKMKATFVFVAGDLQARFRRRTFHEPNLIH